MPKKNNFLSSLKKNITSKSEKIQIGGDTYFIVLVDQSANMSLFMEAERMAAMHLIHEKDYLDSQKLNSTEKAEVKSFFEGIYSTEAEKGNVDEIVKGIKTKYDYEYQKERLRFIGNLMSIDSIRDSDGAKIYSNKSERNQYMEAIQADPDLQSEIQDKLGIMQKKRTLSLVESPKK